MTHILVVDLNVSTMFRIKHILEDQSFTIDQATTIQETMNRIIAATPPFDMVILDVQLGSEDGYSIMERLHTTHPGIVFVVLTSLNTRSSFVEAIKKGASDYVLKPYEDNYFRNKLIQHFQSIEQSKKGGGRSPKVIESFIYQAVKTAIQENSELLLGLLVIYHDKNGKAYINEDDVRLQQVFVSRIKQDLSDKDEIFERGSNAIVLVLPKKSFEMKEEIEQKVHNRALSIVKKMKLQNTYVSCAFVSLPNEVNTDVNALSVLAEKVEREIKGK